MLTTTPWPKKRWGYSDCTFGAFLRKIISAGPNLQVCVLMVPQGKVKGCVGLLIKRDEMPNFISFHCIIHQEALVSKLRNNEFQNVMQRVVHVVHYIVSRALYHWQFRQLIQDYDTEYSDLVLHSNVRWLSCGKMLERFLSGSTSQSWETHIVSYSWPFSLTLPVTWTLSTCSSKGATSFQVTCWRQSELSKTK